jgi:hypothetical protein
VKVLVARRPRTAPYRLPRARLSFDPSRSVRSSTVSRRPSSQLPYLSNLRNRRRLGLTVPGPYSARSYSSEKYDEKVVFQKMVILLVLRHLTVDPAVQRYIARQEYFRGPWWRLLDRCHDTALDLRRPSWVYLTDHLESKCATNTYTVYCTNTYSTV